MTCAPLTAEDTSPLFAFWSAWADVRKAINKRRRRVKQERNRKARLANDPEYAAVRAAMQKISRTRYDIRHPRRSRGKETLARRRAKWLSQRTPEQLLARRSRETELQRQRRAYLRLKKMLGIDRTRPPRHVR